MDFTIEYASSVSRSGSQLSPEVATCQSAVAEGASQAKRRNYKAAEASFARALDLAASVGDVGQSNALQAAIFSLQGQMYARKGACYTAVDCHEKALGIASGIGFAALEDSTYTRLAAIFKSMGRDDLAYDCEVNRHHTFGVLGGGSDGLCCVVS